jgi:hypothetical protein
VGIPGAALGRAVGALVADGAKVGVFGMIEGAAVGPAVGARLGIAVGLPGVADGDAVDGAAVGCIVGRKEGVAVGVADGPVLGLTDGLAVVGVADGPVLGPKVGLADALRTQIHSHKKQNVK